MTTERVDAAVYLDLPMESHEPGCNLRRWWIVVAVSLAGATFTEAVFAGAMLSGAGWARTAHLANAVVLIASSIAAGLGALVTLRRISYGPKLGLTLLSLAAVLFIQTAVGKSVAGGTNLLWLHVPLGVALVGFAMQAVAGARRLGRDPKEIYQRI